VRIRLKVRRILSYLHMIERDIPGTVGGGADLVGYVYPTLSGESLSIIGIKPTNSPSSSLQAVTDATAISSAPGTVHDIPHPVAASCGNKPTVLKECYARY